MTDDLDVLRHDRDVIEPDPQFRAELMDRLRSEMAWRHDLVVTTLTDTPLDDERPTSAPVEQYVSNGPRRHRRRWLAVAAVVLLVASVVAVLRHGENKRDVDTLPMSITGLEGGETMELPRGPIIARSGPAVVWTGSEMIVWGGAGRLDGAAFDPATGSWREIAPAPLGRRVSAQVAWTGREMLVVGGIDVGHQFEYPNDGAAYDPATDTWRRLPDAPIDPAMGQPAWTGEELVVVGLNRAESERRAAAYDPAANEWRVLAAPPREVDGLVWAGEVVLAAAYAPNPDGRVEMDAPASLLRYDPESDRWQSISDESYAFLLSVPDDEGEVRSVLAVPTESGAPVAVLDGSGDLERTLPGVPGARETFGDRIQPGLGGQGTWLGQEALFWMRSKDSPMQSLQTPAPWALDPETGRWRSLGTSAPPVDADLEILADAGLLIGWGPLSGKVDAPAVGIAYRPPGLHDEVVVVPEPAVGALLAKGDVELAGDVTTGIRNQKLNIDAYLQAGEATGEFRFDDNVIRVECADSTLDGRVVLGGTATAGSYVKVGNLYALIISEGELDRVALVPNEYDHVIPGRDWGGYGAGSCDDFLDLIPTEDPPAGQVVEVEDGYDIETG